MDSTTPNLEGPETHPVGSVGDPQKSLLSGWRISLLVLLALWIVIYLFDIAHPPLLDDVDSVHAEAGREMVLRNDWVTIYTDGIRYMEKAPMLYWIVAVSYKIFGIAAWSARLPLLLSVLAMVFGTYVLGRYVYGALGGFYSGLVLVTSLGVYIYTRFLIPEVLIGLWLTLGYYFFLRSLEEEQPSRLSCWGFAVTCALNVLTKGLIGLVFPGIAIAIFLLLTGNLRHLLHGMSWPRSEIRLKVRRRVFCGCISSMST
jgi:4-amino-4-deoxy-L-arabinose transferase-like glycosyltransferase